MNNLIIKKSQIVEAQFTSVTVGQKYQFTEIPNLSQNNIILYGMEVFGATQLGISPNGNTVIPAADIKSVTVTLRDIKKEEFIYQCPAYTLVRSLNGGFITMFKPRIINLTDCYIQTSAAGTITSNMVLCVNFYYDLVENLNQ